MAVEPIIDTELKGRIQTPAVAEKSRARLCISNIGRELKYFAGFLWRSGEAQELARFAPEIFLAAPGDVFHSAGRPIRNRSKHRRPRWSASGLPKISHDWLTGWMPSESVRRHRKTFGADIFTEGKKCVMTLQIIDCRSYAPVDFDLLNTGIALDVKKAFTGKKVLVQFLRAANIQDRIGFAIKLTDLFQR